MTHYEAGLRKLGLWTRVIPESDGNPPIDLRKDPAFAWRVLEAFADSDHVHAFERFTKALWEVNKPSDALYAAVEELGELLWRNG